MRQNNDQASARSESVRSESTRSESVGSEEETVARVLAMVGRGAALPDSTKTAWDATFKGELDAAIARRRRRRQLRWRAAGSCAAAVLVVVLWGKLDLLSSVSDEPVAQIVSSIGSLQFNGAALDSQSLHLGTAVEPGAHIRTDQDSLLGLEYGGAQVRLNENTEIKLFADAIELFAGQLYISSDIATLAGQEQIALRQVTVRTPLAAVTDIGTQFTVSYDHGGLLSTVRDGAIKVQLDAGEYTAIAGQDFAQQIEVSNSNEVAISRTARHGEQWDWAMSLAGEFIIEGRTAYEFLSWATLESGLRLVFEDQRTELNAHRIILHGDISNLGPAEAIDIVLATTNLKARRQDENTLTVSTLTE